VTGKRNEAREERAALRVLSLLSPEESSKADEKLVAEFEHLASELAFLARPVQPSRDLRSRLIERISAEPRLEGVLAIRSGEGIWQETGIPGVSFKRLYFDAVQNRVTMLVRMQPGSRYPSHRHVQAEQCLVLEGDIGSGDVVYHAGDFTCALKDSIHPEIRTETGNLLLIISDPENEFVAA
jgi:quercetin dioxygenase-like cupin family protein